MKASNTKNRSNLLLKKKVFDAFVNLEFFLVDTITTERVLQSESENINGTYFFTEITPFLETLNGTRFFLLCMLRLSDCTLRAYHIADVMMIVLAGNLKST